MAEILARGYPDAALGAEGVASLRMEQITAAYLAIPLSLFRFGLAMGALGHMDLHIGIVDILLEICP
jgi:hypothetical protein